MDPIIGKPAVYDLLTTIEGGITNPELLLQVILISTVYRLVNGTSLKPGDKATPEGGRKMMLAMHDTIKEVIEGEEAQAMVLMAVAAAFLGIKNAADFIIAKSNAEHQTS